MLVSVIDNILHCTCEGGTITPLSVREKIDSLTLRAELGAQCVEEAFMFTELIAVLVLKTPRRHKRMLAGPLTVFERVGLYQLLNVQTYGAKLKHELLLDVQDIVKFSNLEDHHNLRPYIAERHSALLVHDILGL